LPRSQPVRAHAGSGANALGDGCACRPPAESKAATGSIAAGFSIRRWRIRSATPRSASKHQPGRLHGERWIVPVRPVALGSASITVNFIGYNSVKETFTVRRPAAVRDINLISTRRLRTRRVKSSRSILSSCRASARATQGHHGPAPQHEHHDLGVLGNLCNVPTNNVGEF